MKLSAGLKHEQIITNEFKGSDTRTVKESRKTKMPNQFGFEFNETPEENVPGLSVEYRDEIDADLSQGCGEPGCDCGGLGERMFFNRECHPNGPVQLSYFDGKLLIRCLVCGEYAGQHPLARKTPKVLVN